jgi:hypothetical protein
MFVRFLMICLLCGLGSSVARAEQPRARGCFMLGVNSGGVSWTIQDENGNQTEIIPYPWLPGADAAVFCIKLLYVYAVLAEKLEASDKPLPNTGALYHLIGVARRCEREGDIDMAVNCYTEVVRLQSRSPLADEAREQLRRLQRPALDDDDANSLRRLLRMTVPLGLYHNGSVRLGGVR